ncbi:MAG: Uncharacterized protein JWP43_1815 [Ramlibacter sp.]|nr:Uncharacterized protein [Ramlibacter sp.]
MSRRFLKVLWLAVAACGLTLQPAFAADEGSTPPAATSPAPVSARAANFRAEEASEQARQLANWALASLDTRGLPFVIVDKSAAKVFVFDREGQLLGASPALIGLTLGDDSVPGIGQRKISTILPHERTTPAGRFVASLNPSLHGDQILWVDYDGGVALHRVIEMPKERRLQRLASSNPRDRRITYGCINVPSAFFDGVVRSTFKSSNGIVYVMPDSRPVGEVFGSYQAGESPAAR